MELIEYRDVSIEYEKGRPVVRDVSFTLEKGGVTAFLGPNGSGKTTLMSTLTKLIPVCGGKILIDGQDVKGMPPKKLASLVACVPQFSSPGFAYTVQNMVLWGRSPYISYTPRAEDYAIVDETIERFGLEKLRNKPFGSISGGEKQMVLIARAIAQQTPIVLMDEPTTYLDLSNQIKILNIIRDLNRSQGTTFAVTLHDPNHALYIADSVVMVSGGGAVKGGISDVMTGENMEKLYGVRTAFSDAFGQRVMSVDYRG